MNTRGLLNLTAGLLLSVSAGAMSAQASDIAAPAADLWSGFYLGAQAGYTQGSYSNSDICDTASNQGTNCYANTDDGFDISDASPDGVAVGGYLGYNYRINSFVMGLEGDLNWDNADDNNSILGEINYTSSLNWDASVRARLGMVVDERALLYVTGGPSWVGTELDTGYNFSSPDVNVSNGDTSTEFGWVLGAGAEYALTEHLSVKAEYIHGWYGDADLDLVKLSDGESWGRAYIKQDLQTNLVRAGLAYHFGGL